MNAECEPADDEDRDVLWLLNPDEAPQHNVRLTIRDGVLADVRPSPAGREPEPVAVVPPLVNSHTHLEFSGLRQPLSAGAAFPDWIRSVIAQRAAPPADPQTALQRGLAESRRSGVRLIGEITTSDLAPPDDGTTRIVSFREVIGLNPQQIDASCERARSHVKQLRSGPAGRRLPGISPHAPYSVHPDLLAALVDVAREESVPLAMHVAESPEERQLLSSGTGAFREFLQELQLWAPRTFPGGRSVMDVLRQIARAPRGLVVHGNDLTPDELAFVATQDHLSVVYCPRTHAHFRFAVHPWRKLLAAGGRVVLGTDSRASNPDLDVWRELRHAARQAPDLPPPHLLRMITTDAALALGQPPERHRLIPGNPFHATWLDCRNVRDSAASAVLTDATVIRTGPSLGDD